MPARQVLVPTANVATAVRSRLYGDARNRQGSVVWADRDAKVVVHAETSAVKIDAGWMMVEVDLECDQTGRQRVRLPFLFGKAAPHAGLRTITTLDAADPHGLLARWGELLRDAAWQGVLDAMEDVVEETTQGAGYWRIQGTHAEARGLGLTLTAAEAR